MPRPTTRTSVLLRDDVVAMKRLFGTVPNAYERLGIETTGIKPATFARALGWFDVRPDEAATIERAWLTWRARYLKPEYDPSLTLQEVP